MARREIEIRTTLRPDVDFLGIGGHVTAESVVGVEISICDGFGLAEITEATTLDDGRIGIVAKGAVEISDGGWANKQLQGIHIEPYSGRRGRRLGRYLMFFGYGDESRPRHQWVKLAPSADRLLTEARSRNLRSLANRSIDLPASTSPLPNPRRSLIVTSSRSVGLYRALPAESGSVQGSWSQ